MDFKSYIGQANWASDKLNEAASWKDTKGYEWPRHDVSQELEDAFKKDMLEKVKHARSLKKENIMGIRYNPMNTDDMKAPWLKVSEEEETFLAFQNATAKMSLMHKFQCIPDNTMKGDRYNYILQWFGSSER